MKKLILLLAITFSTSLFSQEKFDGNWIYEPSEYVLTIETKNNKLYLYNPRTKDTLSKTIVYQNKNEIMTRVTAVDGIYYAKYKFTNNDLVCVFQQNNYKITYKKQQNGLHTKSGPRANDANW